MYKMCTVLVVSTCVAWSAYIKKENTAHLLCALYVLEMCLFIYEQRTLKGFEHTTFLLPFHFA